MQPIHSYRYMRICVTFSSTTQNVICKALHLNIYGILLSNLKYEIPHGLGFLLVYMYMYFWVAEATSLVISMQSNGAQT